MPVIAPPQSSLRVMPTAPAVDPALFTQVPDPRQGMQMFEQAAKLPLLMEQIKMEKYRQKAEKAKLDLAEQEANWRSQNFAQQQQLLANFAQQQQLLAEAEITQKAAATEVARTQADENLLKTKAALAQYVRENSPLATGQPAAASRAAESPAAAPTASTEAPAGWSLTPQKAGQPLSSAAIDVGQPAPAPIAPKIPTAVGTTATFKNVASANLPEFSVPVVNTPDGGIDDNATAANLFAQELQRTFPRGALEKDRAAVREIENKFRPTTKSIPLMSDQGIPYSAQAVTSNGKVIRFVGDPEVDVKAIYALKPAQEKRDDAWSKAAGEVESLTNTVTRETDIQRLFQALGAVDEAESSVGLKAVLESSVAQTFLPDKLLEFLGSDMAKAKLLARTVIQKNLRATLGAQFAFKEGEGMLDRGFNSRLNDLGNANFTKQQLNDLALEVIKRHRALESASNYYDTFGTLYRFRMPEALAPNDPLLVQLTAAVKPKAKTPEGATPMSQRSTISSLVDQLTAPAGSRPVL